MLESFLRALGFRRTRSLRSELSRRQLLAGLVPLAFLMLSYVAYSAIDAHQRAQQSILSIASDWRWSINTSLREYRNAIDAGRGLMTSLECAQGDCSDIVLAAILRASPHLRSASFMDSTGIVQRAWMADETMPSRHAELEGTNIADREYFRRARVEKTVVTTQPYIVRVPPYETVVAVATAIFDAQGRFAGVLQASVVTETITEESERLIKDYSATANFLLLDSSNHVIVSNMGFAAGAPAPMLTRRGTEGEPATGLTHAVGSRYMYFAELPLDDIGWRMTVFVPAAQSIDATASFLVFILLSSLVGIAIAWASGQRLARTLAVPMELLAHEIETLDPENRAHLISPVVGVDSHIEEVKRIWIAAEGLALRLVAANDNVQTTIAMQRELNARLEATVKERDEEIGTQTAQLRLALVEAEDAVTARNRLLANTSHELRTPLQGIIGSAELLTHEVLTAAQASHVQTVLRCGEGMLQLVNDLLDLAHLRTGGISLDIQPFDVRDEISTIIEAVTGLAEQRGVSFEAEIEPGTHHYWMGDATRLRQVLFNLVTNALKFTEVGKVSLTVRAPIETALRFEVRDTGVGIAQKDQERIFEPFVQVDAESSRWFQGTGLGLAISRQLVELMGGDLEVDSEPGEGSLFYCNVPLTPLLPLSERVSELPATAMAMRRSVSVLLVDDSDVNREVILAQLKALGITAVGARDGFAALLHLSSHSCDLMLLDCQMPGMDGYEVARLIRDRWPERKLPIIAITAHASASEHERCLAAGMNDYLPKPLRLAPLRVVIERYLHNKPTLEPAAR